MKNFALARRRHSAVADPYNQCRRICITAMIVASAGMCISVGFVALTLLAGS
jgi:hypothetical protein